MNIMKKPSLVYRNRGFTLLEMFLVVVIMAAIGFVAARHYSGVSASNRANEIVTSVHHMHAAIAQYYLDKKEFPPSVAALVSEGYLADGYQTTPWGSTYSLAESEKSGKYSMSIYKIPSVGLCKMIYNRLKSTINANQGDDVNYWDDSNGAGGPMGGAGCTTVMVTYAI